MPLRITKPFLQYSGQEVAKLPGHMGVFELANDKGEIIFIGFGLRGELGKLLRHSSATQFRYEITTAYLTRYQELLMVFMADHGRLPADNEGRPLPRLGRLSPG